MAAIPVHQNKNLDEFNKVRNAILENQETGYKSVSNPKKLLSTYPDPGRLKCEYFCYYTNKLEKINLPEKGYYEIWAKATDTNGISQPFAIDWNPKGYLNNSLHRIAVKRV